MNKRLLWLGLVGGSLGLAVALGLVPNGAPSGARSVRNTQTTKLRPAIAPTASATSEAALPVVAHAAPPAPAQERTQNVDEQPSLNALDSGRAINALDGGRAINVLAAEANAARGPDEAPQKLAPAEPAFYLEHAVTPLANMEFEALPDDSAHAIDGIREDFADAMKQVQEDPASDEYWNAWEDEQRKADYVFYSLFGQGALNAMSIERARQASNAAPGN